MAILTEITSTNATQTDLQRTVEQLTRQQQSSHLRTGEANSLAGDHVRRTYHDHVGTPSVERAPGFGDMLEGLVKASIARTSMLSRKLRILS